VRAGQELFPATNIANGTEFDHGVVCNYPTARAYVFIRNNGSRIVNVSLDVRIPILPSLPCVFRIYHESLPLQTHPAMHVSILKLHFLD
jgi:hypothetical protein